MTKTKDKTIDKEKKISKNKRSKSKLKIEIPMNAEGLASILLTPKEIDTLKDLIYSRLIEVRGDSNVFDDGDDWKDPLMYRHLKEKVGELNNIYSKLIFEK